MINSFDFRKVFAAFADGGVDRDGLIIVVVFAFVKGTSCEIGVIHWHYSFDKTLKIGEFGAAVCIFTIFRQSSLPVLVVYLFDATCNHFDDSLFSLVEVFLEANDFGIGLAIWESAWRVLLVHGGQVLVAILITFAAIVSLDKYFR